MKENTFQKIYRVVGEIPCGQVASYGQVAALAGNRRWARVVGYALNVNKDPSLPCHRVVTREGKVSDAFLENGRTGRSNYWKKKAWPAREGLSI